MHKALASSITQLLISEIGDTSIVGTLDVSRHNICHTIFVILVSPLEVRL